MLPSGNDMQHGSDNLVGTRYQWLGIVRPAVSKADPPRNDTVSRRDATRHLLHPHQVKDSLALSRQPWLRNSALAGLQAAIVIAVALPLVHRSPWPHLIGFASLGALVALFGRFARRRDRTRIVFLSAAVQTLAVLVMSLVAWAGAPVAFQLLVLAVSCGVFYFVSVTGQFGAPGPLIFVFAAGASLATDISLQQVLERTAATATVAAFAFVLCAASEGLRHHPTPERPLPAEPVRPLSRRLIAASRTAPGAAIALFISHGLGAAYPAWAAMGAMAVIQGTNLHISMNRALQRMAGTVVGALLTWLVLVQEPSVWTIIGLLTVLQFLTEVVIGTNYGLGQILVTPMALLMTHLAAPSAAGPGLVPERIVDTLLGATVGVIIAVLLSSLDDRQYLARLRSSRGES